MRLVFVTVATLFMGISCGQSGSKDLDDKKYTIENEQLLSSAADKNSDNEPYKPNEEKSADILTLNLSGNVVLIKKDNLSIAVIDLPKLINMPIKLRAFSRFEPVSNMKHLRSTCVNMQYQVVKSQSITLIKANALLNPFSKIAINAAIINKGIALTNKDVAFWKVTPL